MEHQKIPTYISIISSTFSGLLHIFYRPPPFDTLKTLKQGNQEIKLKTPTHFIQII